VLFALSNSFWMPDLDAVVAIGPLWGLAGTIVAIILASLVLGRSAAVSSIVTIIGATLTAWICFTHAPRVANSAWSGLAPAGSAPMLLVDNFAILFILLICLFLACVTGLWMIGASTNSREAAAHLRNGPEFFILLVGSAFGMALMVSTTNLLMIILAIEMASLPSYAIVGFQKRNRIAAEASLKYVLFGAVTSALMVYGISLLYGFYGTLNVNEIGRLVSTELAATDTPAAAKALISVALFGLMAGIGFKISAVPFHFWCPDVFEGASIEVTTWLSVASKAAGLGLLLRIVAAVLQPLADTFDNPLSTTVAMFAAVTCTVGNLAAFPQTSVKRLLAYSSIAHAGYMLMAGAIIWQAKPGADAANPAFAALIVYIIVYLFMNLGAFGCTALVYWATGSEKIEAFRGLGRRSPVIAAAMTVCLFSLVGLPPFGGFIAKFYLLMALFKSNLVWLVAVALLNSLFSLYFYSRIAYAMYFSDDGKPAFSAPAFGRALVVAAAIVILLTGVPIAGGLIRRADQFASHLYPIGSRATFVEPQAAAPHLPVPLAARSAP